MRSDGKKPLHRKNRSGEQHICEAATLREHLPVNRFCDDVARGASCGQGSSRREKAARQKDFEKTVIGECTEKKLQPTKANGIEKQISECSARRRILKVSQRSFYRHMRKALQKCRGKLIFTCGCDFPKPCAAFHSFLSRVAVCVSFDGETMAFGDREKPHRLIRGDTLLTVKGVCPDQQRFKLV